MQNYDVANQHREIIYGLRDKVLTKKSLKDDILEKLHDRVENIIENSWPKMVERADTTQIAIELSEIIPFDDASRKRIETELGKLKDKEKLKEAIRKLVESAYESREKQMSENVMRQIERFAYLGAIDRLWIDHIDHIDGLREGVMLRAYAQRDPLVEFKNEAFRMFESLVGRVNDELCRRIFRIQVATARPEIPLEKARTNIDTGDSTGLLDESADDVAALGAPAFSGPENAGQTQKPSKKIGRNDPCWCGSGKKWKHCHYPQKQQ